ncbi:uncharacterized protein LOC105445278 [Strongylocentrotus purpuratus]|uniref:G-protein coupled receptors family 1 profile domain-containing protein n=1 Tax=Strongylocentrotus purpuratus TaxID=7668 RepID=A0A7M7LTQ9_STRPU|nr:uncharacterized protein LOC105445278 [Strongylocentrotus purpuratus]|eukprot:XP_011678933.1 PREDICTED: uncharacterized protein LOC105445278 [Strongylocentrotus purpuratus]
MDVGSVAIFCVIFITGLPGNSIILAAYAIKPHKKSTDLLIIIQALVDLIACITPQSEMISGMAICWITLITRLSTSLGSLFLTFVIAVDRYVTVCRPFGRHLTKTQAVALATSCLAFSFFVNLTILWYFKVIEVKSAGCIFSRAASALQISMNVIQIVSFFVAVVVSMFSYTKIFTFIRRQARVRSEMDDGLASHTGATMNSDIGTISESVTASDRGSRKAWNNNIAPTANRQSSLIDDSSGVQNPGYLEVPSSRSGGEPSNSGRTLTNPPEGHVAVTDGPPSASMDISATQSSAAAPGRLSQPGENSGYNRPTRRAHGDRTTKMLLCITVVLIVSWIPYVLVFALPTHVYIHLVTKITSHQVVYSITRIRGFNHMINAFVYWAVNPVFRQDVKRVFIRLRKLTNR